MRVTGLYNPSMTVTPFLELTEEFLLHLFVSQVQDVLGDIVISIDESGKLPYDAAQSTMSMDGFPDWRRCSTRKHMGVCVQ